MAVARKCDACGKFYKVYNIVENRKKPSGIRLLNIDHEGKFYQHKPIDLCPDCMTKVMYVLNQKKEEKGGRMMLIIKNEEDEKQCTSCWGNHFFELTTEEVIALLKGKTLGDPNFDEYGTFIRMETKGEE